MIACMKDTLACNFYYPRHTAIITTGCNYLYIFVAPWFPLYHQDVSFDLLASVMSDDVLGEYVGKRGLWVALAPWKDFPREVIFMEMTYKYIHRLTLGQNHRHTIGGIHPIIEDQYAGLGLHCKTTMKDICQFHDSHSDLRLNLWILSWTIWNRYVSSYRPKKDSFSHILLYLNGLTNLIFNLHAKDIHDFFNRR